MSTLMTYTVAPERLVPPIFEGKLLLLNMRIEAAILSFFQSTADVEVSSISILGVRNACFVP